MTDDPSEGGARVAKASIKEAIGKIIGNGTTEAEGAAEIAGSTKQAARKRKVVVRRTAKT